MYNLKYDPEEARNVIEIVEKESEEVVDFLRRMCTEHMETISSVTPEKFITSKVVKGILDSGKRF